MENNSIYNKNAKYKFPLIFDPARLLSTRLLHNPNRSMWAAIFPQKATTTVCLGFCINPSSMVHGIHIQWEGMDTMSFGGLALLIVFFLPTYGIRPPIKSAVAFLPVTSKPTTTTRRTSTTRRTTFDENGQDFEIISIPLISSGTPPPPKQRNPPPAAPAIDRSPSQRVTAEIEPNNDASRVVFPED